MDLPGQLQLALGSTYRIERELGRGGMAAVYLAHDLRHDRPVALKVLHPELAQTLGPDRFDREIKLAARLQHPHILTVLDSGDTAGNLWFTMPYVDGESLRDRLTREGQLSVEDAVRITREAAAALDYSHRHDVVHRDIKPENILLTRDGDALVADFGIARALSNAGDAPLTQTGMAVGTPAYMSPEQASGGAIDVRTDVYSLASVLYEMLTGEPPFTGPNPQAIIARRFSEPVRPIRGVRETVPQALEQAVLKALARAPGDRHASAAEFSRALGAATGATTPGGGTATQAIGPATAIPRRRSRLLIAGVAIVALAGAGLVWSRSPHGSVAPAAVDASGLAVLPFRVVGPGLDLWREGLVDLLSMDLDGAASLHAIPPRTVLSRWHREVGSTEADQESALRVARGAGARYALNGSIIGSSGGVRLSAELIDVVAGKTVGQAQVEGPADSVPALVDRLSISLMRSGLPDKAGGRIAPDLGGSTTHSITALKHLLTGEQLFRGGKATEALEEYRQALAADSTFALATYRLAVVDAWSRSPHYLQSTEQDLIDRVLRVVDRLPPREATIARMLPLLNEADLDALPQLETLAKSNPSDVETWFQYADALFHIGGAAGEPRRAFRDAITKVIDLDPAFGPAYLHLAEDAFDRLDSAEVNRIVAAVQRIEPTSPRTTGLIFARDGVWGDSAARSRVKQALDTAQALAILTAKHAIDLTPDLAEPTFLFGGALAKQARFNSSDRANGNGGMGYAARNIGQLRRSRDYFRRAMEAQDDARNFAPFLIAEIELYDFLQGLEDSTHAEAAYQVVSAIPDSQHNDPQLMGLYAAARGRLKEVERWAVESERRAAADAKTGDAISARRAREDVRVLRAYAAEVRGDRHAVLRELSDSIDVYRGGSVQLRFDLGRRLLDAKEYRDAIRYFDSFDNGSYDPNTTRGLIQLYRARASEGLGDLEGAKTSYGNVVRWWKQCDPELVPIREQAREALARLTAEPTGTRGTR